MFASLVGEAWAWILSPVVREASVACADEGNIKLLVGDLYLSWGVLFAFSLFLPSTSTLSGHEGNWDVLIARCTSTGLLFSSRRFIL